MKAAKCPRKVARIYEGVSERRSASFDFAQDEGKFDVPSQVYLTLSEVAIRDAALRRLLMGDGARDVGAGSLERGASAAGEILLEGEEFARSPGGVRERGIGQRRQ